MFVETINQPHDEWERWASLLRIREEPPAALVASIAWDAGDGMISGVNVWDRPDAIADFYIERVRAVTGVVGEPTHKPARHGPPVYAYFRETP